MVNSATIALQANVADLRKEFPLAAFRILDKQGKSLARYSTVVPITLVAWCPASMREVIHDRMQQAIQAVQVGTASLDISGVNTSGAQHLAHVGQLKQQLQKDFRCGILLVLNTSARTCNITCLKVLLPAVEAQVRAVLGLPGQQPQAPAAVAAAVTPLEHEQIALKALLVSCF